MTAAAVLHLIGREGALRVSPALAVAVRIVDVKWSYGNLRYLVAPLAGLGQEWVDSGRVVVVGEVRSAMCPDCGHHFAPSDLSDHACSRHHKEVK